MVFSHFLILFLFLVSGAVIYALLRRLKHLKKLHRSVKEKLKHQSTEIQELTSELDALSYSVSHDLRAPLRAVNGFSRILQKDYSDHLDEEGKEFLSIIYTSSQKMNSLIDDLLTYSRLGRKKMEFTSIDLNQCFNELFQEMVSRESKRDIKLKLKKLPLVHGDRSMIEQVLFSFLSNAIKFTRCRTSAVIEIGCQAEGSMNTFTIKDNGIGFDMAYTEKIFGLFQKLHKPEDYEGNGSGLTFVKRIIQRHGGSVSVESAVNQGATFYFSLPSSQ